MNLSTFADIKSFNSEDLEILRQRNEIYQAVEKEPMNIQALEQRINRINHVEQIIPLLEKIGQATSSEEKYASLQEKVKSSVTNARTNTLAIATVGTTNAGKSTTQAALFGFAIAPARNSAATSIPTTFIYAPNLKEPKLEVSEGVHTITEKRLDRVRGLLEKEELTIIQEKLNIHPQAKDLLPKIISKELEPYFRKIPSRCEEICNYLHILNDAYRVCSILGVVEPEIQEFPKVLTPFYGITKPLDGICRFYDTPGRDEAGQSNDSKLFELILNRTQKVILVASYSQLGTKAFEKVKNLCAEVIKLRGKESLLILVNMFKSRESHDMTKEEVIKLFQAQLGIEANQIIEVSSLQALQASSARHDLQVSSFLPNQIESVKQLVRTYNGLESTEESGKLLPIKTATKQEILEATDEVWKASGFQNVIQEIELLLENSKHETQKTALTLGQNSLKQAFVDISATKQRLIEEKRKSEELAEDIRKVFSESKTEINYIKDTVYASVYNESGNFKEQILPLFPNTERHEDFSNASSSLQRLQALVIQISSTKVSEKLEVLRQKYEAIQNKLINLAKELKLDLVGHNWTPHKVALSIENVQPYSTTEKYFVPELRQKFKTVSRKIFVTEFGFRPYHPLFPEFGGERTEKTVETDMSWPVVEPDGFHVIQVSKTRTVYHVSPTHLNEMVNQIEQQIHNIFYSEEISQSLSLESFNVQLENHINILKQEFESKLQNLTILELTAQEKLNLLIADLDSIK